MVLLTFAFHISSWIAIIPLKAVTVRSAAATNSTMTWVGRARNTGLSVASEVFVGRIRALYKKKSSSNTEIKEVSVWKPAANSVNGSLTFQRNSFNISCLSPTLVGKLNSVCWAGDILIICTVCMKWEEWIIDMFTE